MTHHLDARPELLAPAGGFDALRAAVANGADAVYLGVDRLNARRGAENFTLETLHEACRFAHLRGTSIYLTANVIILPDELADALTLIDDAWAAGVDAVIIQDLGLLRSVRLALPHVRVHASTQMNAHSRRTVLEIARLGASRVTLSRETSLEEISGLAQAAHTAGAQVESFVHGAICMCYSGQCLLSSLIGGRSANRGMCAQPCRLTYELVDASGKVLAAPGAHLLSPKDLAGIAVLPQLVASGVDSLKIEGRMKSAEYVAIVTGVYSAALDRAAASPESYDVREGEMSALSEAFSRGFSEAYLIGERGNEMMSYTRPNNRGVLVGRITETTVGEQGREAIVTLTTSLASDDVIEVWTGRGRFTQTVGQLGEEGAHHAVAPAGDKVRVRLEESASPGDRIFRVRNAELAAAAARTFQDLQTPNVPVDVAVRMVIGEPLSVGLTDARGREGLATGQVIEPARTKAVGVPEVMEHVGRFGGTAFSAGSWDVELSPNAGVGYSELHRVRREAVEALERAVLGPWTEREPLRPALPALPRAAGRPAAVRLVASAASPDVARACLEAGADEVHLPADEVSDPRPDGIVPLLSRVSHDVDEERQLSHVASGRPVVAGTLGLLAEAARRGASVQSHWSLNALNAQSVAQLAEMGAGMVWLSPELNVRQIAQVAARSAVGVGVAVSGRQEVMVTEHCILMAEGECSRSCASCGRRRGARALRDRKGYEFPVITDRFGRSHLFNSVPLDVVSALPEILEAGVAAVRIDVHTLEGRDAAREVRRVREALDAVVAGSAGGKETAPAFARRPATTSGHFFRGVS